MKRYLMLNNFRFTAFTISGLLRENQKGKTIAQIRVNLGTLIRKKDLGIAAPSINRLSITQ